MNRKSTKANPLATPIRQARRKYSEVLSSFWRASRRGSAYAFAAGLGVFLPKTQAATLINLDATGLATGPLTPWANTGTVGGDFASAGDVVPEVVIVDGVKCVGLTNLIGTVGAPGTHYAGPAVPVALSTNKPRTVEAWILNPVHDTLNPHNADRSIITFGRRQTGPGNNFNFGHGVSPELGALNTTGEPQDTSWGNYTNLYNHVVTNQWTYVACTYDGTNIAVYADGVLRNTEFNRNLNTLIVANDNVTPLIFRLGRQSAATGGLSAVATPGPLYIARVRVKDTVMSAGDISTQFNTEKGDLNYKDTDGDGMDDWYEYRYGLNPASNDAAGDPDTDTLTNLQEFQKRSNPNAADTDGDGASDSAEVNRTDPQTLLAAPTDPTKADSDGDGLLDGAETDNGTTTTDPLKADTDGDTYSDGAEVAMGSNPMSPGSKPARLIDLDATSLAGGTLLTNWNNLGTHAGLFSVRTNSTVPMVTTNDGVKGVNFLATGGANGGTHYTNNVPPPTEITGAGARAVEAWIFNPTPQGEEAIFSWGGRGTPAPGPVGENWCVGHGQNRDFGAVAIWGNPDIGWNNNQAYGRWTHIAATYGDEFGTNQTTRVYTDGVQVAHEVIAINTRQLANDGTPFPFRIARQSSPAIGGVDGTGTGAFNLARLRVYTNGLDAATIRAHFDAEKAFFGLTDSDGDGIPDWYEIRWGLDKNDATGANGALGDPDGDSLTNLQEYQYGTAPNDSDSDDDAASDSAEVNRVDFQTALPAPTNPLNRDTDGDTLLDGAETDDCTPTGPNDTGSDPLRADSDSDGYSDLLEFNGGSSPCNAASFPDPSPLINLNAATNNNIRLPLGTLTGWTNSGTYSNGFSFAPGDGGGVVQTNQGVKSVVFAGGYLTGPPVPALLTGNPSYSIEAWVNNPVAADEETVFAWGGRAVTIPTGPDGRNSSFNHGLNGGFGAMGHWGGPDLGWGGAANVIQGRWTHVAYTYNSLTLQQLAYVDGAQVNSETLGAALAIAGVGNGGEPLPFRVASQNDNDGDPTGGLRGNLSIGELKVYARTLSAIEVTNSFHAGKVIYGILDSDSDGMPDWFERAYPGCLNQNSAADATTDCDGDGLNNLAEFAARTSPVNSDTDGDGLSDGTGEAAAGNTNPTNGDTELDGLLDGKEVALTTDPFVNADKDGDTFLDFIEVLYGSNPNVVDTPDTSTPKPFVNLDATGFAEGPLATWTNNNGLGWRFIAPAGAVASVQTVDGSKGVTFNGTNYYTGPGMPAFLGGNSSHTVEAWIYNPAVAAEETVFAWGRRGGGPDGSNVSFIHGTGDTFGALGYWASSDMPWGTNATQIATNVVASRWTYVAYTYDSSTVLASVYKDGVLANSDIVTNNAGAPLATHLFDPSDVLNTNQPPVGRSLPFRVGAQNDANGGVSVPFATMTIAKLRAYNAALSAGQIAANYNAERVAFPGQPVIRNVRVDANTGFVIFDWTPAPGHTYAAERKNTVTDSWSTIATGLSSGSLTNDPGGSPRFYRLRIE